MGSAISVLILLSLQHRKHYCRHLASTCFQAQVTSLESFCTASCVCVFRLSLEFKIFNQLQGMRAYIFTPKIFQFIKKAVYKIFRTWVFLFVFCFFYIQDDNKMLKEVGDHNKINYCSVTDEIIKTTLTVGRFSDCLSS